MSSNLVINRWKCSNSSWKSNRLIKKQDFSLTWTFRTPLGSSNKTSSHQPTNSTTSSLCGSISCNVTFKRLTQTKVSASSTLTTSLCKTRYRSNNCSNKSTSMTSGKVSTCYTGVPVTTHTWVSWCELITMKYSSNNSRTIIRINEENR